MMKTVMMRGRERSLLLDSGVRGFIFERGAFVWAFEVGGDTVLLLCSFKQPQLCKDAR